MLVINIWESDSKQKLMKGSSRFGHAAMTLAGRDTYKSCYISWWPGGENTQLITHGKIEDRAKDRRFDEDLWAENHDRYLARLLFTLPHQHAETFVSGVQWLEAARFPARLVETFAGKGLTLGEPEALLLGALEREKHWVVDDTAAKKAWLCYKGTNDIKIQEHEGHRFLWEVEMAGAEEKLFAVKDDERHLLPPGLCDLLKEKKYPVSREDDTLAKLSFRQRLLKTRKNDLYITVTGKAGGGGDVVRFFHWTRQYLAPTWNVSIPTIAGEGRGLDDVAIRRWWTLFNEPDHPKWSTFDRNCSVIVMTALKVGGAGRYAKPHGGASWLCWTPNDILIYSRAIVDGISKWKPKKKNKPLKTVGAPTTHDDGERDILTSTIVWTKAQFVEASKKKGVFSIRSPALQKIDRALDAYHGVGKQKAFIKNRVFALGRVLDEIAEYTAHNPGTGRAEAIFQLAERIVAERSLLIPKLKEWKEERRLELIKLAEGLEGFNIDEVMGT